MLGLCLWYAKNKEEAEEILQDGFMRVFTYIHQYAGSGSLEGWIRKIMINAALLKYRNKTKLRALVELNTEEHDHSIDDIIISRLNAKELLALVQDLPPAYRMVFNLHVMEGLKHREIAELLGISEGTSKSNLADARAILKKQLTVNKKVAAL